MKTIRRHLFIRGPVVALVLAAWFVLTNHCALVLMERSPAAGGEHALCHRTQPKREKAPEAPMDCCKTLRVAPMTAKADVCFDASNFVVITWGLAVANSRVAEVVRSAYPFDHGPPRVQSFAEAVLQRSLLSHAPPVVA